MAKKSPLQLMIIYPSEGGKNTATILVSAKEQGSPAEMRIIHVYRNGKEITGSPVQTDETGQATLDCEVRPGKHLFVVRNEEINSEITRWLNVPAEKEKKQKADTLRVERIGTRGKYTLRIEVVDSSGKPVPKSQVCIMDRFDNSPAVYLTVGSRGAIEKNLEFAEPERVITILLPGTDKKEVLHLLGPQTDDNKDKW